MTSLRSLPILIAFLALSPRPARAEHEVLNGGQILRISDSEEYYLADLRFRPIDSHRVTFDADLVAKLRSLRDLLEKSLALRLVSRHGVDLFEDEIFGELVDYRFVSEFPKGCAFTESARFSADPRVRDLSNVGCTQGSITYLQPSAFRRLDLDQKALLIIHERLHAYAPLEAIEVKAEFTLALAYFDLVFFPGFYEVPRRALARGNVPDERYCRLNFIEDHPFRVLNEMSRRVRQLNGTRVARSRGTDLRVTRSGALLITTGVAAGSEPEWTFKGDAQPLCLGARIVVDQSGAPASERWTHTIESDDLRLVATQIFARSPLRIKGRDALVGAWDFHFASTQAAALEFEHLDFWREHSLRLAEGVESVKFVGVDAEHVPVERRLVTASSFGGASELRASEGTSALVFPFF
mgnify:CR=1 FL=1